MAASKKPTPKKILPESIALALQSGGVHGAFAWGGVHQLLQDGRVGVHAISATGGGAIQAVVIADGFRKNGVDGAIENLERLWKSISISGALLPIKANPFAKFIGDVGVDFSPSTMALDYITRLFSPYQFNLLDLNPLKGIVSDLVDFDALQKDAPCPLFVNATHVKTGACRVFREHEMSLDAVMASCCLPFLFKTVKVDGEPYWDGAYSGNPLLKPLISTTKPQEIVLIQTIPSMSEEVPTNASDILDRATEISFHQALRAEMALVGMHNAHNIHAHTTLHVVESSEMLAGLGRASKLNVDWDFLTYLHDLGAQAMQDWLDG